MQTAEVVLNSNDFGRMSKKEKYIHYAANNSFKNGYGQLYVFYDTQMNDFILTSSSDPRDKSSYIFVSEPVPLVPVTLGQQVQTALRTDKVVDADNVQHVIDNSVQNVQKQGLGTIGQLESQQSILSNQQTQLVKPIAMPVLGTANSSSLSTSKPVQRAGTSVLGQAHSTSGFSSISDKKEKKGGFLSGLFGRK